LSDSGQRGRSLTDLRGAQTVLKPGIPRHPNLDERPESAQPHHSDGLRLRTAVASSNTSREAEPTPRSTASKSAASPPSPRTGRRPQAPRRRRDAAQHRPQLQCLSEHNFTAVASGESHTQWRAASPPIGRPPQEHVGIPRRSKECQHAAWDRSPCATRHHPAASHRF